ncbi:ankyrin repeat domain-containing protein [Larkinella insperata]|uniref:Ankyrin repeat domain-containing protein n=1 Tax=Larkinella insperata TaxID=332158 RepID=A0ABW3QHM4_9BACT|nr:ankyrin repeat domain-containing protein [Larkinella insperata]
MNKILTVVNWTVMGLLALFLILTFFNSKKGGDAAGQGQGTFWLILAAGALAVLLVVNLLPFRWGKYAGLAVILLPFFLIWFDDVFINLKKEFSYDQADYDGSRYFADPQRKAIARALSFDRMDELERLLREPVPLINDARNPEHWTLLDYAARSYSSYNTVYNKDWNITRRKLELLLEAGAKIENADPGRMATHAQCIDRCPAAMLQFFLDRGADPNTNGPYEMPLLFNVIHHAEEPLEKIQILLDHGVPLQQTSTFDVETEHYSPLLFAAHLGHWNICLLLIQKGADVRFKAPNGFTLTDYLKKQEDEYARYPQTPSPEFETVKSLMVQPNQ